MTQTTRQFWVRRIIWALLVVITAVFVVVKVKATMYVSGPALDFYRAVEAVPKDKIIVISCDWEAGTRGENSPQTEALIRQCFEQDKRFAIFGWVYPPGPTFGQQIAERLAPRYHKRYGRDWVNWGFKAGGAIFIRAWAKDIPGQIVQDIFGTPITRLPAMQGICTIRDVGLIASITPSASVPVWIRYIYGFYRTKIVYACTGVMAPEAFPYYDAHQVAGVLKGLTGAAEYETLLRYRGDAMRRMPAQSAAHAAIILLIVIGNVIYIYSRRRPGAGSPPGR